MSIVTWGIRGRTTAVIFCNQCREVLSEPVPIYVAWRVKDEAATTHVCGQHQELIKELANEA